MRAAAVFLFLVCSVAANASAARAEGFSPFGWMCGWHDKSDRVGTTGVASKANPTPMFAKMKGGTQRLMTSTKNLFTAGKPQKRRGVTASYPARRVQPKSPSFFKRLFSPEPPAAPKTVDEWMSLEQVRP